MIFTPAIPSIIEEFKISYTQAGTLAAAGILKKRSGKETQNRHGASPC